MGLAFKGCKGNISRMFVAGVDVLWTLSTCRRGLVAPPDHRYALTIDTP